MFKINTIQHVSVIVADTNTALDFYNRVLELEVVTDRPELGFPGAWLQVGTQQIHLLEVPNPDPVTGRPEHGGRDRHTAFDVMSLDELVSRLDSENISYTLSRSGRKALFCRDPDGNTLEFIESNAS